MRKDRILNLIRERTEQLVLEEDFNNGMEALEIALLLKLDRANVSKELNNLWKEGKLIKLSRRPVLYLDYQFIADKFYNRYIPSTINKNENLYSYIMNNMGNSDQHTKEKSPMIDVIIGADGSLKIQLEEAKAAINYPPNGIATLLMGNAGVGKYKIATSMLAYAIANETKPKKAKFMRINCRDYESNPLSFSLVLLGTRDNGDKIIEKGCLEKANSGIVYLENIECLSNTSMDLIFNIIERNQFSQIGSSLSIPLTCTIIASCRPHLSNDLSQIQSYFPLVLMIPDLDNRPIFEKIELILDGFHREAKNSKKTMRVHKDIISCFALTKYCHNLTQLKNEIKLTCSKAHVDALNYNSVIVNIDFHHLTVDMMALQGNANNDKEKISSILKSFHGPSIVFAPVEAESPLITLNQTQATFQTYRTKQFLDIIQRNLKDIKNQSDYIYENINCLANCGENQLLSLEKSINPIIFQCISNEIENGTYNYHLGSNTVLYGIMLHVSNVIMRAEVNDEALELLDSSLLDLSDVFERSAYNIYEALQKIYKVSIDRKEIDFLAQYLQILLNWVNTSYVSILIIAHGDSIAEQYYHLACKSEYKNVTLDFINFTPAMQLNDCLELTCTKAQQIDQGSGVIILCDGSPLLSASEYVQKEMNVRCRTLYPLSYQLVYDVLQTCNKANTVLETLTSMTIQVPLSLHQNKEVHNEFIERLTDKFISPSLCFMNPVKTVNTLNHCLEDVLKDLNIRYSDGIAVKFLCHCSHMLERVIQKESLLFPNMKTFMKDHKKMFNIIEKGLKSANKTFGISIPSSELCYVTEIFLSLGNSAS